MKKKFILMLTLLAGVLSANADNVVSVSNADVPQGGTGVISIDLANTDVIASFQLDVTLPDGLTFAVYPAEDEKKAGDPVAFTSNRTAGLGISSSKVSDKTARFILASTEGNTVTGNSGTVLYVKVAGDASLVVGDKYAAKLEGITLSKEGATKQNLDDVSFNAIAMESAGVILDENYEFEPEETTVASKVIVKRTIVGDEWNTICLPFAMTEAQVIEAFGSDAKLAYFAGYGYDSGEDQIELSFEDSPLEDGIDANYPYLIKTSADISKFSCETIITPDDPIASINTGTVKKPKYQKFTGVYKVTTVPEQSLFIVDNKFYYSAGLTKIKAFRGYFTFTDVLADGARSIDIDINIDGTTGINNAVRQLPNDGNYYNLKGQRVEKPSKGVFIVNGKKVVVK